jgi:hypothetical protein
MAKAAAATQMHLRVMFLRSAAHERADFDNYPVLSISTYINVVVAAAFCQFF